MNTPSPTNRYPLAALLALTLFGMSLPPSSAQAADLGPGLLLSASCMTCHGPDGRGSLKIPKLKGEKATDLLRDLKGYKGGDKATVMQHIAKGYSDEELKLMADYFSALGK